LYLYRRADARPSSTGSTIEYLDAPYTVIYPRTAPHSEQERPTCSGSIIIHEDAPITIIYPTLYPAYESEISEDGRGAKRQWRFESKDATKRRKTPLTPSPTEKTTAVVVLCQDSLSMATDFAAFWDEFERRGIAGVYLSVAPLDKSIKRFKTPLIYGRDEPGKTRKALLEERHKPFYEVTESPPALRRRILEKVEEVVRDTKAGETAILILIGHGDQKGRVLIEPEVEDGTPQSYVNIKDLKKIIPRLCRDAHFFIVHTGCYAGKWLPLAKEGANTIVHAASSAKEKCHDFETMSLRKRGGIFSTVWLEVLKKNEGGSMQEFFAEVKTGVEGMNKEERDRWMEPRPGTPHAAVGNHSIWAKPAQLSQ
jgi:Caspase domain